MCLKCHKIVFLQDFLNEIYYDKLDNPKISLTRISQLFQYTKITGKNLLRLILELEGDRLKVYDQSMITSALDHFWPTLREKYETLADNTKKTKLEKNRTNNENVDRISRLDATQILV